MRTSLLVAGLMAVAVGAYASAPAITAWQIREAVRTGDAVRLQANVDWPSVRKSLKSSIGETRKALEELAEVAQEPRPSVWQRLKVMALPYLTDPLVERYVTPEGVPKLYAWRQMWRQRVQPAMANVVASTVGATPPPARSWLEETSIGKGLAQVRRVERWAFVSPTRFEIELADRVLPRRRWFAALETRNLLSWQLTEMKVLAVPAATPGLRVTDTVSGQR